MNFLTLFSIAYSFTIGVSESSYVLWEREENPYGKYYCSENVETDFYVKLNFWRLYVGGGTETTSQKEFGKSMLNVGQYAPLFNDYSFSAGYAGKYFNVGYEYRCIHPTMAYLQDRDIKRKKDGAYQRVFVTFQHELRFK